MLKKHTFQLIFNQIASYNINAIISQLNMLAPQWYHKVHQVESIQMSLVLILLSSYNIHKNYFLSLYWYKHAFKLSIIWILYIFKGFSVAKDKFLIFTIF